MGRGDKRSFTKRFDLYMLLGADLILGRNILFQWE